jgi:acyl carrier protein
MIRDPRVAEAVHGYIARLLAALGKPASLLASSTDLFAEGVLDSVGVTAMIAAVEQETGQDIDFIDVDPDSLDTVDSIIEALSRALAPRS